MAVGRAQTRLVSVALLLSMTALACVQVTKSPQFRRNVSTSARMIRIDDLEKYHVPSGEGSKGAEFLRLWTGYDPSLKVDVGYLRDTHDIVKRADQKNCTPALEVLAWLMDEMQSKKLLLVLAYGELIHFHRERDFVESTTGRYLDDDIDLWAYPDAVMDVIRRESDMFKSFGWTARVFVLGEYIVFLQLTAVCGHTPKGEIAKAESQEPGIELYPLSRFHFNGTSFLKDLWQDARFPETMISPPVLSSLVSSAFSGMLRVQLPNKASEVMTCIYGDWTGFSSKHAAGGERCGV